MPLRRKGHQGGKLKAAARRWAGERGGSEPASEDALTQAVPLPERAAASAEGEIELGPGEWEPAFVFFSLETQWRRHPMTGCRLGIDYAAIEPTARMLEIPMTPQLLLDIRTMEGAALEVLAKQA